MPSCIAGESASLIGERPAGGYPNRPETGSYLPEEQQRGALSMKDLSDVVNHFFTSFFLSHQLHHFFNQAKPWNTRLNVAECVPKHQG